MRFHRCAAGWHHHPKQAMEGGIYAPCSNTYKELIINCYDMRHCLGLCEMQLACLLV